MVAAGMNQTCTSPSRSRTSSPSSRSSGVRSPRVDRTTASRPDAGGGTGSAAAPGDSVGAGDVLESPVAKAGLGDAVPRGVLARLGELLVVANPDAVGVAVRVGVGVGVVVRDGSGTLGSGSVGAGVVAAGVGVGDGVGTGVDAAAVTRMGTRATPNSGLRQS